MDDTTILCVTHSSRRFVEARCSINALEQRFGASKKAKTPPPFETLNNVHDAVQFSGALSLWQYHPESRKLTYLKKYDPGYKIQSAAFSGDHLLVYGHDRLEVLDRDFKVVNTIKDRWLAGGHTVYFDADGHAWITSAASNAIMKVDVAAGRVVERIAMPAQYGRPYDLTPEHDVREHFIPTDHQPTHVNCAFPAGDHVYVTLWVPGVVGCFDRQRNYRELVHGFRGCHGGKIDRATGDLYLTDSPSGIIWFFDVNTGAIRKRLRLDSLWLHDAEQVDGDVFAAGLSDKNELLLIDTKTGDIIHQADCASLGQSVMFVSTHSVDRAWMEKLSAGRHDARPAGEVLGPNLLPPLERKKNPLWLNPDVAMHSEGSLTFASAKPLKFEYLFEGAHIKLSAGEYVLSGQVTCRQGGLAIGLLDKKTGTWVTQMMFDHLTHTNQQRLTLDSDAVVRCAITAYNSMEPTAIASVIQDMALRKVMTGALKKTA